MAAEPYPRADLLIEPSELARPESRQQFIVLDARDQEKFTAGHIPAARWIDHAAWSKAFDEGQDAPGWSRRIAALGIAADSKVVLYDDELSKAAARIWWILEFWGVRDVRLLNGGWIGWTAGQLPVEKGAPTTPAPATFEARPQAQRLATKRQILDSLAGHTLQIVDARSEGEFCGTEALKNRRAGAIPGARHLEWSDLLDKTTGRFKPADELRGLFRAADIDLAAPSATHCQGGGRAAVMAFALELMGTRDVANYYRSWGEWGNADDTPVVPGKTKP